MTAPAVTTAPPILYPWPPDSTVFHCATDQYWDGVITLWGGTLPPGVGTIYRVESDDSYFVIRGGQSFPITGDFQRSDTEAMFDVENRYILEYKPDTRAVFHNWFRNPSFENSTTTWSPGSRTIEAKEYTVPDLTGRREHYLEVSGYTGAPIFAETDRRYDLIHDRSYGVTSPSTLSQRLLVYTKPDAGIVWTAGREYRVSGRVQLLPALISWAQIRSDPETADPIGGMTAPPARDWSDPLFGAPVYTVERINFATNPRAVDTGATSGWAPNDNWGTGGAGIMSYATVGDGPENITTVRRKEWTAPTLPGANATGMRVVGSMSGTIEEYFLAAVNDVRVVSVYMRHTSNQSKDFRLEADIYGDPNSTSGAPPLASFTSAVATIPAGMGWHRVSVSFVVPQGAAGFAMNVRANTSSGVWDAGERFEATGMLIEEGSSVEDYFDGTTDAETTRWAGVPNASASEVFTTDEMSSTWADILGLPSGDDLIQGSLYLGLTNSSGAELTDSPMIKVMEISLTRPSGYLDFEVTFELPATTPIGDVNIAFYQGDGTHEVLDPNTGQIIIVTDPDEFHRIWSFDNLLLDYANQYYGMTYFDGATEMPNRAGIGYDVDEFGGAFAWDSGDATVAWMGTADDSASVFTGASVLGAYTSGCMLQSRTAINGHNICEPVFLSDPIIPGLSQWLGLLNIGSLSWDPRRELLDVLGRHPPVALSQYRSTPHAEFRFLTNTLDERIQFIKIINAGRVLLLRNPDPHYPENMWYVSIGSVSEERIDPDHRNSVRRWVCDLQVVDRPSGLIAAMTGQSWQTVKDIHTDWQDVETKNPAWLNVLLGDSPSALTGFSTAAPVGVTGSGSLVAAWDPVPVP